MSAPLPAEDALDEMAPRSVPHDSATLPPRDPAKKSLGSRARALGVGIWKYLAGVIACQNALLCVLANGWTYRLAQRSVLKRWWKMSDQGEPSRTPSAITSHF